MSRAYKEKKKWRGSCPRSLKYQNRNARRCAPLCPALLRSSPRGVARAYYYDTLTDWVRAFSCHFIGNGWAWPMVNCTSSSSSTSQKPFDTQHSSTARVYWGRVPPRFAVRCAPLSNSSDSASVKRLLILFYFISFYYYLCGLVWGSLNTLKRNTLKHCKSKLPVSAPSSIVNCFWGQTLKANRLTPASAGHQDRAGQWSDNKKWCRQLADT